MLFYLLRWQNSLRCKIVQCNNSCVWLHIKSDFLGFNVSSGCWMLFQTGILIWKWFSLILRKLDSGLRVHLSMYFMMWNYQSLNLLLITLLCSPPWLSHVSILKAEILISYKKIPQKTHKVNLILNLLLWEDGWLTAQNGDIWLCGGWGKDEVNS